MQRVFLIIALTIALCVGLTGLVMASNQDNHNVTVTVNPINELDVVGGDVTLTIDAAIAGNNPNSVVDNTTDLKWTTNQSNKKITVATSLETPKFTLQIAAQNVNGNGIPGTASPEFSLDTTARDLVTVIATTAANCKLRYTATATAAQGTGKDEHTVTYTLTQE